MSNLSRRRFITVATQSIAATVMANPSLAALLPEEAKSRPVGEESFEIAICDSGYIYDPHFDYSQVEYPTWAEFFSDRYGLLDPTEDELYEALADFNGDSIEETREREFNFDDEAPLDYLSTHDLITNSEYWVGYYLLEHYDFVDLDMWLVEGEYPGHSFAAVKVENPEGFEKACLACGLNVRVTSIGENLY